MATANVLLLDVQPRLSATGARQLLRMGGGGADYPLRYGGQQYAPGLDVVPTILSLLDYDGQNMGVGAVPQALALDFHWPKSLQSDSAAWNWKGAPFTLYFGPENAAGTLPTVLLTGTVLDATWGDSVLHLAMADPAADLQRPVLVNSFAGTGGIEGPGDWEGKPKRRAWGYVFNVEGFCIDTANNVYSFTDPARPLNAISEVRDKGAVLTITNTVAWQGSVAATFAALQTAFVTPGCVTQAPSIGMVKTWTRPAGILAADLQGELNTAPSFVYTPAAIVETIVAARAGPGFVAGTVAAASALRNVPAGYLVDDLQTSIADAMNYLLGGSSLFWVLEGGAIRIGEWTFGGSAGAFTSDSVDRAAILPPLQVRKVGYRRNYRQLAGGDLAAILTYGDGTPVDDLKPAEAGANITGTHTAAAITGQGALATMSTVPASYLRDVPATALYPAYAEVRGGDLVALSSGYQTAAVGPALGAGSAFVEGDIITNVAGFSMLALDNGSASYDYPNVYWFLHYYRPTGAWTLYGNAATLASGNAGTVSGRLGLYFNGFRLFARIGGTIVANLAASSVPSPLWPKWWAYGGGGGAGGTMGKLTSGAYPEGAKLGSSIYLADGVTIGTDGVLVTAQGTAAGIAGQGALATKNTAAWTTDVTGTGKPSDNADVTSTHVAAGIAGQGDLATTNLATLPFGANGAVNTDFAKALTGWISGATASDGFSNSSGLNLAGYYGARNVAYSHLNGHTLAAGQYADALISNVAPFPRYLMPVKAGDRVFARALIGAHRCTGQVFLFIFDKTGAAVETPGSGTGGTSGGGTDGLPSNFTEVGLTYTVTNANAAWAALVVRMVGTGGNDPYLFSAEPAMGHLPAGQTILPPYVPGRVDPMSDQTVENTAAGILGQGWGATATQAQAANSQVDGNVRFVRFPGGGGFADSNGGVVGRIKVCLPLFISPTANTTAMLRFKVDIYDYNTGMSVTYIISGYAYGWGPRQWINVTANLIGSNPVAYNIDFGTENAGGGERWAISIGENSTTWDYPQVRVYDVQIGYENYNNAGWDSDWLIFRSASALSTTSINDVKPKVGDALFGENVLKNGSVVATLAEFQTLLGTAAGITGQGALATTNSADWGTQVGGTGKPENNADITSAIAGPAEIVINASYTGTITTLLPRTQPYLLKRADGTDATTSAAWACSVVSGTMSASIGAADGVLSIDASSGALTSGRVHITATISGKTYVWDVTVTKVLADAPSTGGGGSGSGGSASGSISGSIGTTMAAVSDELDVTEGSVGTTTLNLDIVFSSASHGNTGVQVQWYKWNGSAFAALGSPVAAGTYNWTLGDPVEYSRTDTDTGNTASSVQKYKLYAKVSSGTGATVSGSVSAVTS